MAIARCPVTYMHRYFIIFLLLTAKLLPASGQLCSLPGQTPNTARLVCGTSSFYITTPQYCGITPVPNSCPSGFSYADRNPNYFRMNCFSSGTLGFTITPDDAAADYNWQLFDITNYNPVSIYTNPALFVASNWSPEPGETGATSAGTQLAICAAAGESPYSQMPDIIAGHAYMLLVSNQSAVISGYNISFDGGSASITDDVEPHPFSARASCTGNTVVFKGNKKLACNAVAADGSDFSISGGAIITAAAPAPGCTPVLGGDSIIITLAAPLPVGNYTLTINSGSDGNTLLDACNRPIAVGENISFIVTNPQPITMDSLFTPGGCSPDYIELVFKKGVSCSSIAPDGSDFIINGPQAVSITAQGTNCGSSSTTGKIRLRFTTPLLVSGIYTLQLTTGSDGNALIDECGMTVGGNNLSFNVLSPLSADFTYSNSADCRQDSTRFLHNGNNNANNWFWNYGDGQTSTLQNPVYFFPTSGNKTVRLIVSNGICSDTSEQIIFVADELKASFDIPTAICVLDTLPLRNTTTGLVQQWYWQMGDGNTFSLQSPGAYRYRSLGYATYYTVMLIANNNNCSDTVRKTIEVLDNCLIKVPTAFTPNGDGLNDFLFPANAVRAAQLRFSVYNRYGQLVFTSTERARRWDGTYNNQPQATGIYTWHLQYTDTKTGIPVAEKGTVLLLR